LLKLVDLIFESRIGVTDFHVLEFSPQQKGGSNDLHDVTIIGMSKPIEYAEMLECLDRAELTLPPAEIQGAACGLLAVDNAADKVKWVKGLIPELALDNVLQKQAILQMGGVFDHAQRAMQDSALQFDLYLPDDDEELIHRLEALQDWCQGFLFGMTLGGIESHDDLPEDTKTLVEDFMNIGSSGDFDIDDEEESETAFTEIAEYVRLGILLINEELQPMKQHNTVH